MANPLAKLTIAVKVAWPNGIPYRGRYPLGPTLIASDTVVTFTAQGTFTSFQQSQTFSFSWEPPTQNLDNSAITQGQVTSFDVGIRSGGTPGVYPIIATVDDAFTSADLVANIDPPLSPGTYFAAVRTSGPTPGAWSATEGTFTL